MRTRGVSLSVRVVDMSCLVSFFIDNLALGQPTTQSGHFRALTSDLAVDENHDPNVTHRHCSFTLHPKLYPSVCDEISWWMVDLGASAAIEQVTIYNPYTKRKCMRAVFCRVHLQYEAYI